MTTIPKSKVVVPPKEFVTVDQFNDLAGLISKLNDKIDTLQTKTQTPQESKEDEQIRKAKHDATPMPESWEETAREIIGEAVDHCEMLQPRSGGTLFTIVIKPEFSNAPKDYLERMKLDRRTKEIGSEGIAGVELFCKLVRANLKRSAAK